MMYRMLIVDDEPEIVESLYEFFLEIAIPELDIMRSSSSREALLLLDTVKIDILLTDIRMPGINGFQLAEAAKKNWPKCRTVFLTGYNDFEYAYSAIKGECEDYILKTESNNEIVRVIKKTIDKIEKNLRDEELIDKAIIQMKSLAPILQREYIVDLIEGVIQPSDITPEKFEELTMQLDCGLKVYVISGRLDDLSREGGNKLLKPTVMTAVKITVENVLSCYLHKMFVEYDDTYFLCLVQQERDKQWDNNEITGEYAKQLALIKGSIETVQNICRETLNSTVSFALCNEPVDIKELGGNFKQLKRMLDFSIGIGNEALFTEKSFATGILEKINNDVSNIMKAEIVNVRNIGILATALERGLKVEYFEQLSRTIDCLRNVRSKNNNQALEIYYTVASCLLSYINRWMFTETIAFKIGLYKLMRVDLHDTWDDAVEYLYSLSNEIFSVQSNSRDNIAATSVSYVKQYIKNHLEEDLSLVRLADLVYFNPSYLSRLFKQVTGMNISEYIIEARIAKAKILLTQKDLKIQELAQAVGLESPIYFSRVFKKATNMTPQEYREFSRKK